MFSCFGAFFDVQLPLFFQRNAVDFSCRDFLLKVVNRFVLRVKGDKECCEFTKILRFRGRFECTPPIFQTFKASMMLGYGLCGHDLGGSPQKGNRSVDEGSPLLVRHVLIKVASYHRFIRAAWSVVDADVLIRTFSCVTLNAHPYHRWSRISPSSILERSCGERFACVRSLSLLVHNGPLILK